MIKYIIIAIVGIIEAFGSTLNSKFRQKTKKLFSFITAYINILVWYYIFRSVYENIDNFPLIIVYATFYSLGDILGLCFDEYLEKVARFKGLKIFKKKKTKLSKKKR
ncbi:MAG TPA: DUF5698 domain-containing protein [Candidatus Paceibacterota bacterium]|nr:DUF5698 domain-containing protein [Candidatus Paceibacterota bacterium]